MNKVWLFSHTDDYGERWPDFVVIEETLARELETEDRYYLVDEVEVRERRERN